MGQYFAAEMEKMSIVGKELNKGSNWQLKIQTVPKWTRFKFSSPGPSIRLSPPGAESLALAGH